MPDALVSTAACGMTSAFGTVFAIISTRRLVPGLSLTVRIVGLHPHFDRRVRGVERRADQRDLRRRSARRPGR